MHAQGFYHLAFYLSLCFKERKGTHAVLTLDICTKQEKTVLYVLSLFIKCFLQTFSINLYYLKLERLV